MEKKPVIVAQRLTELREGIHVSQARLAAVFDLDQPAIFRYESGKSFPPYGVLMQYADFFGVSLDYIFGGAVVNGNMVTRKSSGYPFFQLSWSLRAKINRSEYFGIYLISFGGFVSCIVACVKAIACGYEQ